MIGFNNGIYQKVTDICIPITSMAINRGYGAFDFFEVLNGKPFYGDRHFARFSNSLKELKLTTVYENELAEIVSAVIARNKLSDCYITIFALPHVENNVHNYEASLYVFPSVRSAINNEEWIHGSRLLLKNYQRDLPQAKSISYLFGQFLRSECIEKGALDVLYYNGTSIQETSRGNIFMVKNGCVYTSGNNVLKGITRSVILDIMKQNSYLFEEKEIRLEELFAADEVFVTSTTKHVMPIVEIHNQLIGNGKPGEITQQLMKEFNKVRLQY